MSLRPDDRSGRSGRSHSRTRERSRSAVREEPSKSKSKSGSKSKSSKGPRFEDDSAEEKVASRTIVRAPAFNDDDSDEPPTSRRAKGRTLDEDEPPRSRASVRAPSYMNDDPSIMMPTMPGGFDEDDAALAYDDHRSGRVPGLSSLMGRGRRASNSDSETSSESDDAHRRNRKAKKRSDKDRDSDVRSPRDSKHSGSSKHDFGRNAPGGVPYPASFDSMMPQWPQDQENHGDYHEDHRNTNRHYPGYSDPAPYQYAEPPSHLTYSAKPQSSMKDYSQTAANQKPRGPNRSVSFSKNAEIKEVRPLEERSSRLSVGTSKHDKRAPSPLPGSRMDRLSISGGRPEPRSLGAPPASPLLEAYHGTYQSISPMPSPIMHAEDDLDDLPSLSLSADEDERDLQLTRPRSKSDVKAKKRVKLYDAEGDADKLAKAMNHREAKTGPLTAILPELTHDQLLALREEYKKRVKVQGRGVNISKQIKATTTGNFGKVCYVTALGRWESESYWANFWYQSHSSNRELLIEALMGRSNADIREINDSFKDKRYQDSLLLCMEKELKPDKFRTAILTALEGRRQEETDTWPPEYRNRDVETLHRALKSREGGESAILDIVIRRSSNHLREVLKTYDRVHEANFAREALKKSNNLVGEVIAHILNGAINRPARDCLLLRHALNDVSSKNKDVDLRYELLMSRLIRLHWDRLHLARVKEDYKQKYHVDLEKSVQEASKGDFGAFCVRLCET